MPAPKAIMCYICGKPYLGPSIGIHIPQCIELFEKRESLKPVKERRKLPSDPALFQSMNQSSGSDSTLDKSDQSLKKTSSGKFYPSSVSGQPTIGAYGLTPCPHCNRTFNDSAYERHVKICEKVFMEKRTPYDAAQARIAGTEIERYKIKPLRTSAATKNTRPRTQSSAPTMSSNTIDSSESSSFSSSSSSVSTRSNVSQPTSQSIESIRNSISALSNSKPIVEESNEDVPKWKSKSDELREGMKLARMVTLAEKKSKETGIPLHQLLPAGTSMPSAPKVDYVTCPTCGRSYNETAGARHIPQCKNIINKPKFLHRGSGTPGYSTNTADLNANDANQFALPSHQPSKPSEQNQSSKLQSTSLSSQRLSNVDQPSLPSSTSTGISSTSTQRERNDQYQESKESSHFNQKTTQEYEHPRSSTSTSKISSQKNTVQTTVSSNATSVESQSSSDINAPKWKSKSDELREGMKLARMVTLAEKKSKETGIPLHQLLPAGTSMPSAPKVDYVTCPTCGRSYNETAGARHIPQCKNIINKPKFLHRGSGTPGYSTNTVDTSTNDTINMNTFDSNQQLPKMNTNALNKSSSGEKFRTNSNHNNNLNSNTYSSQSQGIAYNSNISGENGNNRYNSQTTYNDRPSSRGSSNSSSHGSRKLTSMTEIPRSRVAADVMNSRTMDANVRSNTIDSSTTLSGKCSNGRSGYNDNYRPQSSSASTFRR